MTDNNLKYYFNGECFSFFPNAKYSGKSIISGKRWNVGDAIMWKFATNKCCAGGIPLDEWEKEKETHPEFFFNFQEEKSEKKHVTKMIKYHHGPVNTSFTNDDSSARKRAIQVFKKEYNINLIPHPGLFVKISNSDFIEVTNGKYCEDLIYIDDKNPEKMIFVEVERTLYNDMFDINNKQPINILAAKYWKYFYDGNVNHTHYLCFINENLNKACVISNRDIKFNRQDYITLFMKDGSKKEFYQISKRFAKIYDLDKSPKAIMEICEVEYQVK